LITGITSSVVLESQLVASYHVVVNIYPVIIS